MMLGLATWASANGLAASTTASSTKTITIARMNGAAGLLTSVSFGGFGVPTTPGATVAGFPRSDPGTGLRSGDALPGGWCATTWDRAGDAPAALTGGHSHTGEEPLWSAQGGQRIIRVGIQTAEGG